MTREKLAKTLVMAAVLLLVCLLPWIVRNDLLDTRLYYNRHNDSGNI